MGRRKRERERERERARERERENTNDQRRPGKVEPMASNRGTHRKRTCQICPPDSGITDLAPKRNQNPL